MNNLIVDTIEDCLEVLVGLKHHSLTFTINKTDGTILNSIARQVFKGTPLTDRQYALMIEKLLTYKEQFEANGIEQFDIAVHNLRNPLRQIDRRKYITLVSTQDVFGPTGEYDSFKADWQWLKVRFPFRKTEISLIGEISNTSDYQHQRGSHTHFFPYTETNLINLLDRFSSKDFVIDEELIRVYKIAKDIEQTPATLLSGIYDLELRNIKPSLQSCINQELGELNNNNLIHFIDRRFRYGFNAPVIVPEYSSLIEKLAYRNNIEYLSKPSEESISDILGSLWKLNRFPMLVILDENDAESQLYEMVNYFRDIMDSKEQSVLFRLEGADAGFNHLIKDRKLNNWVDKTTKVVYISSNKIPKVIVNNEWKPTVAVSYNSKMDKFVDSYIKFNCDLVVYREEVLSPFRKYSKFYA